MNNRYATIDVNKNKRKNNMLNLNRLSTEETKICPENNINILKILDELEKKNTTKLKKRFNFRLLPLLNPNNNRFNQTKLNRSLDNNVFNLKKENDNCNNNNGKNNDGCFLTSLAIEVTPYNSINANEKMNKNIRSRINDKISKSINRNYHLKNIIKDIRNKIRNSSYACKTEGNFLNENLAYDDRNIKPILDINNILNFHIKNQDWDLRTNEEKYKNFIESKKGVCTQNLIIKLMKEEREKINKNYLKSLNSFKNNEEILNEGEKVLEQIIVDQKKNNKIIEDNYYQLIDSNKLLLILRESFKEQVRKTEYEILKKIYEIDELRVYAKFINYMYGYDYKIYEKSLVNNDYTKNPLEAETLTKNLLKNYDHFLTNGDKDIIHSIDPDIIYNEIRLIEDRILLNLKMRDNEYEDLKRLKENNRNILENIENKKNQLEDDYNYINKELNDIIINTKVNLDEDLFLIAKDLFIFILEQYCNDKKLIKKYKEKLNLFEISDLSQKSMELILKRESMLDLNLKLMEKFHNEDKNTFGNMINKRKEEIIIEKTEEVKKNLERKRFLDKIEINKNSNKIYFLKRKVEVSMPKKKKKIIKLNPEVIKQMENKELINYE